MNVTSFSPAGTDAARVKQNMWKTLQDSLKTSSLKKVLFDLSQYLETFFPSLIHFWTRSLSDPK